MEKLEILFLSLAEIELSAVSEAMNQMIGSAATSMATMFMREVNISPPISKIWNDITAPLSDNISDDEPIVKVSFSLKIGDLVDSNIMQLLPIATAKKIVSIMMGQEEPEKQPEAVPQPTYSQPEPQAMPQQMQAQPQYQQPDPNYAQYNQYGQQDMRYSQQQPIYEKPAEMHRPPVEVHQATFQPLATIAICSGNA